MTKVSNLKIVIAAAVVGLLAGCESSPPTTPRPDGTPALFKTT